MIFVCLAEMFPKSLERDLEELEAIIAKDENFKSSAKAATFDFGLTSLESSEVLTASVDGGGVKLSLAESTSPAYWGRILASPRKNAACLPVE